MNVAPAFSIFYLNSSRVLSPVSQVTKAAEAYAKGDFSQRLQQTGDPETMWNTIVDTIARTDRSFVSLVGRASCGSEFDSGELIVTVRPGKIRLAEDKLGDITRAARSLFGSDVFVSLRAGDPDAGTSRDPAMSEQEATRMIDADAGISDIAADVENLFGIKPEITG